MLRSDYCNLSGNTERELCDLGECPYDQVGWWWVVGGCCCWCMLLLLIVVHPFEAVGASEAAPVWGRTGGHAWSWAPAPLGLPSMPLRGTK